MGNRKPLQVRGTADRTSTLGENAHLFVLRRSRSEKVSKSRAGQPAGRLLEAALARSPRGLQCRELRHAGRSQGRVGAAALPSAEGTAKPRRNERPLQVPTTAASAPGWARQPLSLCRPGRGPGLRGDAWRGRAAGPPRWTRGRCPRSCHGFAAPHRGPLAQSGHLLDGRQGSGPGGNAERGAASWPSLLNRKPAPPTGRPAGHTGLGLAPENHEPDTDVHSAARKHVVAPAAALGSRGGDHGRPLEAEDRPLPLRPPPPLPHRPQAVGAAADPTRPDPTRRQPSGRAVRTPGGGRSPCPAQHEGVSDRDHGAQLRTLRVVVLAAVFTPCEQTSSVRADGEGRGAPKGRREAPCQMGVPGSAPHEYETVRTQDVPPRNTPSMQSHPQGDRERDLPEEWR